LFNKASAAKAVAAQALTKANRYIKQRRLALKRIKELGRREDQNILELKINKIMTEGIKILKRDKQFPILKALNSSSPRLSFFTVLIGGERSTNPFLELLNSPDRNTKMP
jgi:hypothetical protein